jgi:hypothetical protein
VAVTGYVTDPEACLLQVDRLVNSHTLHGSEALCKLLRYLADHALKHPGALKEYQIATEVFGRPADFDPHLDSLVRVQAGRLRAKVAEYYASEGAQDSIVVELPKGTYTLAFHRPTVTTQTALGPVVVPNSRGPSRPWLVPILAATLAAALFAIAALALMRSTTSTTSSEAVPASVRTFWRKFASGPEPWVIFSNGAFVGRPETGLRYFNPASDSRDVILDHYTGVGEVLAVHDLDHIFELLKRPLRVKRGSLFTLDDVQNNDLIFVGSPAENLTLREIPSTKEFTFQRLTSGPRANDLALVNVHPQPGEAKMFLASPSGAPLTEDYAIIGLVPGMNPAHSVLILAGTTTIGTQAAAEYVCRQDSLEQLLLRLSVSENGEMKPFEAVLRVKVARGVPFGSELVALRRVSR